MPPDGERKMRKETGSSVKNGKGKSKKHHKGPKLKPNSEEIVTYTRRKGIDRHLERKSNSSRGKNIVKKHILQKTKFSKKHPSAGSQKDEPAIVTTDDLLIKGNKTLGSRNRRKKRKRRKDDSELDEASRIQRRTRYLLIKVKREQNLIDAYSAEGWKGQSREKIKPEKELERAKAQIVKCKLGIREAIRQMELLSSKGSIDDTVVASDGSVHHEHIICAKCNLREAFPENDIILCDGTCNCAFHQKCLDPPLSSENIPPGDEGWFCRYCKSKMEILEATNAHLGTNFPMDCTWEDIFKEEALLPDGGDSFLLQKEEWPSDDSEDCDYDPESSNSNSIDTVAAYESDASGYANSSSSFRSLDDDAYFLLDKPENVVEGIESNGTTDHEVLFQPRPRASVDYIRLNDELFGKNYSLAEQISEDEDWGPSRRKRRRKEPDGLDTASNFDEPQGNRADDCSARLKREIENNKRVIFRFPHNAVEKLRSVFAENELPSRAIRQNLSVQLGLEAEKVNKWFKNARYLALKARKKVRSDSLSPTMSKDISTGSRMDNRADNTTSRDAILSCEEDSHATLNGFFKNNCTKSITLAAQRKQNDVSLVLSPAVEKGSLDFGDDISLKHLREKVRKKKKASKRRKDMKAEKEMKRLCEIKNKVEKLQQILHSHINRRSSKVGAPLLNESSVVYVPVAELREKR